MGEITPNTPNPVREDAYVEELAEKLGIDPQFIPKSPVWRNEEEIKAIAEMFSNMSGGSSGGGVLVVNATWNDEQTILTLDKTWKEIFDACFAVAVVYLEEDRKSFATLAEMYKTSRFCSVSFVGYSFSGSPLTVELAARKFTAATENDYPQFDSTI